MAIDKKSQAPKPQRGGHAPQGTDKRLANRNPDRSCRLHVRDNAEGK